MRYELLTTLTTRVALIGLSAATAILTARLLGPVERGQFFLALTTTGFGVQLFCLGLHSSNTYFVADNRLLLARLHANSVWVTGACAALISLLAAAAWAANMVESMDAALLALALLAIPPGLYYLFASNLLLGAGQTDRFNRFELLGRIAPLVLMLAFAFHASAGTLFFAYLAGSVLVAVLLFRGSGFAGQALWKPDRDLLKRALRYGFRAYLVMLLGFLLARIPVFILGALGEAGEIGQMSVAIQVGDMMALGPSTVAMLLFPRLVRESKARERTFGRWLLRVALVMLPACLLMGALSNPVIPWVFGQLFERAAYVMYALLPGVFFLALISVMSQYLAAVGLPWSIVLPWILGVCVSAGVGMLLTRDLGAQGAAIGISCAYATVFLCMSTLCWRRYGRLRREVV